MSIDKFNWRDPTEKDLDTQKKLRRKPKNKKMNRSRFPIPDPNSNEYSPILRLGFTLIKFFFFFVAGVVITYVFTWFFNRDLAIPLLGFGLQLISPLLVVVLFIVAIIIIIESSR